MPPLAQLIASCHWDQARFLIVSANVFDPLIYYSHLLPLVASLLIGVYTLWKNPRIPASRALFVVTALLAIWLFGDLVLWATEKPPYTIFIWCLLVLLEPTIYAASLYFVYAFITGRDMDFRGTLALVAPLFPTILLAFTRYSVNAFDLTTCNREAIQGPLVTYGLIIEVFYIIALIVMTVFLYRGATDRNRRREIITVILGVVLMLTAFSWGNIVGTITVDWQLGQYGLFGIPFFVGLLGYSIVAFRSFNIRVLAAQAVVVALGVLVLAMLLVTNIETVRYVVLATLLVIAVMGTFLVRGVKRDIKQKEEIEGLVTRLRSVNRVVSHDVKSTLAKNRDAFAALLDGSLGVVANTTKPLLTQLLADTSRLIHSIMEILAAGQDMVLHRTSFSLKDTVLQVIDSLRKEADAKGITIETHLSVGSFLTYGDRTQLMEHVIRNLIENAIIYNVEGGSVIVSLSKSSQKMILLTVRDTGYGISDEDKPHLFTEGGRGKNSVAINVHSSGYGLAIAKKTVESHGGRIWFESGGILGIGTTFFVELPVGTNSGLREK